MKLSSIRKLGPALAVISTLAGTASADQAQQDPLIQPLPSAFAGLNWGVSNVPLGVDFATAMRTADPSMRLEKNQWTAKRGSAVNAAIAPHQEYRGLAFGSSNIQGVSDRTRVSPTHWHSGDMVWRVERTVKSSNPELMPTADDLSAAVVATFGPDPVTDGRTFGRGGVGQRSFQILAYPIKNGTRHTGPCFDASVPLVNPQSRNNIKYPAMQDVIAQIESGQHCEAVLVVMYVEGRMGRLAEYRIIARDFLMEAKNFVHDVETRIRLLEQHQNNLPTVAPEL